MKKLFLLFLASALGLAGCGNIVLGVGARCEGATSFMTQVTGTCEREIEELTVTETQSIAVQTSEFMPFADIAYAISVKTGTVEASFVDSSGNTKTYRITPDSPITGSITVQIDAFNQIKFDLKPLDGSAKDITWQVDFVCECLP